MGERPRLRGLWGLCRLSWKWQPDWQWLAVRPYDRCGWQRCHRVGMTPFQPALRITSELQPETPAGLWAPQSLLKWTLSWTWSRKFDCENVAHRQYFSLLSPSMKLSRSQLLPRHHLHSREMEVTFFVHGISEFSIESSGSYRISCSGETVCL